MKTFQKISIPFLIIIFSFILLESCSNKNSAKYLKEHAGKALFEEGEFFTKYSDFEKINKIEKLAKNRYKIEVKWKGSKNSITYTISKVDVYSIKGIDSYLGEEYKKRGIRAVADLEIKYDIGYSMTIEHISALLYDDSRNWEFFVYRMNEAVGIKNKVKRYYKEENLDCDSF